MGSRRAGESANVSALIVHASALIAHADETCLRRQATTSCAVNTGEINGSPQQAGRRSLWLGFLQCNISLSKAPACRVVMVK